MLSDATDPNSHPNAPEIRAQIVEKSAPAKLTVAAVSLQLGQSVRHPKFGLGTVLAVESDGSDPTEERALINFELGGKKWMAVHFAKMRGMSFGPLCAAQETVDTEPYEAVVAQFKAPKLVMPWGAPTRAAQMLRPVAPPWDSAPALVGPFDTAWVSPGRHAATNQRKHRRHKQNTQIAAGHFISFICSAIPPFKQLRNVLGNMSYDLARYCQYDFFQDFICAQRASSGGLAIIFDLSSPIALTSDTRLAIQPINHTGYQARLHIQRLRQRALENSRWWPAPQRLQLVLDAGGAVTARMKFAYGYQPEARPWLELAYGPKQ